jgi:hypothetical protein
MSDLIRFAAAAGIAAPAPRWQPPMQPGIADADTTAVMPRGGLTLTPSGRAATRLPLNSPAPGNALPGLASTPSAVRAVTGASWLPSGLRPVQPSSQIPGLANWPAWASPRPVTQPGGLTAPTAASRSQRLAGLPSRQSGAVSGTQFIAQTQGMPRAQREQAILQQISNGNVPDFNRQYKPVQTSFTDHNGQRHTGTFYVLPDYLAIGNNRDFVRMPMSPLTAQQIADKTGAVLPTRKMVDAIYGQAQVQVAPRPQQAGPQMMSNDYYSRHQQTIQSQLAGQPQGALVAGHKKDVVLSNRLVQHPDKVAIYGWHQPNGRAIQPLSTVHENTYADYSHGIRLVAPYMEVDGRLMKTADVMRSSALSGLVSDEGPLQTTRVAR